MLCFFLTLKIYAGDKAHLPKDLIFELHYLGSVEYSFSLNFSRPAAPIIAQYFNFVHLGFEGYRRVALADLKNARLLSRALEKSGYYYVLSDVHRPANGAGNLLAGAKQAAGVTDEGDVEVKSDLDAAFFSKILILNNCRTTSRRSPSSRSASRTSSRRSTPRSSKSGFRLS